MVGFCGITDWTRSLWLARTYGRSGSLQRSCFAVARLCWLALCIGGFVGACGMKFFVVFAVIFVGVWLWRNNRKEMLQSRNDEMMQAKNSNGTQATDGLMCALWCSFATVGGFTKP